jgi:hypothetical protein
MTRLHLGFIFLVLYVGWVIYRWLIKKDIKQHKDAFYLYTLFVAVWSLIYFWFFFKDITHLIGS